MPRFRPGFVPSLATALAVAVLSLLGIWQVRRLHWRAADLAAKNAQIDRVPAGLAEALADPAAYAYRRVVASGIYDSAQSIVVAPVHRGLEEGARVLTPLFPEGTQGHGPAVMVDRGWLPSRLVETFLREDLARAPVASHVTGLAFVLDLGGAAPGTPEPAARRTHWVRFDPSRPAQAGRLQAQLPYPLASLLLQAEADGTGQFPLGGFERPTSPVDHRAYAITWFSMAVLAAATWLGLGLKQGRERPDERVPLGRREGPVA